jgi:hypothetical protein
VLPLFVNASLGEGILTFFPFEANIEGSIVNSTPKKKKKKNSSSTPEREKKKNPPKSSYKRMENPSPFYGVTLPLRID